MKPKRPHAQQRDLFMPQDGQLALADESAEQRAVVRKLSAEARTCALFESTIAAL